MNHKQFDKHLVSLIAPASFAAEQYQALRLKIERIRQSRDLRVIAITSPGAADGKTVTSINLAAALGRGSNARVLIIDADLRRPALAQQLHVDAAAAGVAELVANPDLTIADAVRPVDTFNLDVITAGQPTGPVHELFRSPRLERLLQGAREQYDFIVIDTPPLLPVFDASMVAKLVDGLLLVVAANQTPRKLLGEALTHLDPSKVLGLVYNRDTQPLFGYYNSSYYGYFDASAGAA